MAHQQFSITVKEHGRLNLPKDLRQALGIEEGERLIFRINDDGSAEVVTPHALARRGRGLFAHLKQVNNETDSFIDDRRQEADQ
ncbi:AbrB/MazE/SpoVT family DNA-binding domain-containing protein [Deinococcus sonorensis]|uniref:AbrB/MazE/SpoVT family DNA-binding domain-containing protein n=2 Tax=Deinococcus sonorensis TaxID=309891 RepID=A0AAU7U5V7_9DEIO